jgi:hypothetical protein
MLDCDQTGGVGVEGDAYFGTEGFPVDQAQEEHWGQDLNLNL